MARGSFFSNSRFSRRRFAASVAAVGLLGIAGSSVFADETAAETTQHPLTPALRHAKTCVENVQKLNGYECTFAKKEVVADKQFHRRSG